MAWQEFPLKLTLKKYCQITFQDTNCTKYQKNPRKNLQDWCDLVENVDLKVNYLVNIKTSIIMFNYRLDIHY